MLRALGTVEPSPEQSQTLKWFTVFEVGSVMKNSQPSHAGRGCRR